MPPIPRGIAVLCLPLLLLVTTACGAFGGPLLEVGPAQLRLDNSAPVEEIAVSNGGGDFSVLRWRASADSPLIHVTPSEGEVRAGDRAQTLRISVDFSGLRIGEAAFGTVTVDSNGGRVELPVEFLMGTSRACSAVDTGTIEGEVRGETFALSDPASPAFVPGELLIAYREPAGEFGTLSYLLALESAARGVRSDHGLERLATVGQGGVERVAASDPQAAAARLAQDPRVEFAHPNYLVHPLALPNDPCLFDQWNLQGFGVAEAWQVGGNEEVVVAVIDTGIDVDHEDLAGKILPGYDVRDDDGDPRPGAPSYASAHGTHVAGIALAQGDNGVGVAGVAYRPNIRLLPVKIFDDSGTVATTADLADAMLWAAGIPLAGAPANPYPADVINMSVGAGAQRIPLLEWAADRARREGALLLAAAGNNTSTEGELGIQAPANAPAVIAVGSVDQNLSRSSFSDWGASGPTVDVMAPGGYGNASCQRVRSTVPWSDYGCMAGTSMAAPFAAGVAALILSREPQLTPAEVTERLLSTTFFDPALMNSDEYGYGVLCAQRAVTGIAASSSTPCGSP